MKSKDLFKAIEATIDYAIERGHSDISSSFLHGYLQVDAKEGDAQAIKLRNKIKVLLKSPNLGEVEQ